MSDHQNDDWSWFWELLTPLRARSRDGVHPSRAVLHAYLKGQLPDTWRVRMHPLGLGDWTLTEVSQHVLTCGECTQQLALLRRRELERVTPWRDLWHGLPSAIRAHFTAYAFALVTLLAMNAFFVMVLPAPIVLLPCTSSGGGAGPVQPADPQTADVNLKLDGVTRPVKLPPSLSGTCVPVPAPRPLWQTWWIGWVFLFWTMLLGLHILWDIGPAPRRTAATSSVVRSIGFAPLFV